jgi:hypothetical protein
MFKGKAMITDAQSQVDLIAALHLEGLFKMGHLERVGDKSGQVTKAEAVTPYTKEHDSAHLLDRLAFVQSVAVSAHGLSIKMDRAEAAAISRAAENVAVWRTYLSEDCVATMINDGWHFST